MAPSCKVSVTSHLRFIIDVLNFWLLDKVIVAIWRSCEPTYTSKNCLLKSHFDMAQPGYPKLHVYHTQMIRLQSLARAPLGGILMLPKIFTFQKRDLVYSLNVY